MKLKNIQSVTCNVRFLSYVYEILLEVVLYDLSFFPCQTFPRLSIEMWRSSLIEHLHYRWQTSCSFRGPAVR